MGAKTPRDLTLEQILSFTDDFQVPVFLRMHHNSVNHEAAAKALVWPVISEEDFSRINQDNIARICHYPEAIPSLNKCDFQGRRCLVVGSSAPWLELYLLKRGADYVHTLEYRPIIWSLPPSLENKWGSTVFEELGSRIEDQQAYKIQFDAVISYSSLEHSGLGRYGDPINPNGDLETIDQLLPLVESDAAWYIAVPIGQDSVLFNRHRVYGRGRISVMAKRLGKKAVTIVHTAMSASESDALGQGVHDLLSCPLGTDGIQRLIIFR